jgi:hypothetical protein
MDQAYWLAREQDSIANARAATLADVRLIHYDLASSYSVKAAEAKKARLRKRRENCARAALRSAYPAN